MRATVSCPATPGRWMLALLLALAPAVPARAQERDTAAAKRTTPVQVQSRDTAVAAVAAPAHAHERLQVGDRILIECVGPPGARCVGRLVALGEDTLVVALAQGRKPSPVVTIPRSAVSRVWVSDGRSRRTLAGLGIGLVVGAALGAGIGAASYERCSECFLDYGQEFSTAVGAAGGGAIGLVVGGVAGSMIRGDRWRAVQLSPSIVAAQPLGDRLGLAVRVHFGGSSQ